MTTEIPQPLRELLSDPAFPAQRAFSYSATRWSNWLSQLDGLRGVLDGLPRQLDRAEVARQVEDLLPDCTAGAFVTVMIWGHGRSGYGPYRTARILTGSRTPKSHPLSAPVVDCLAKSVEVARGQGAVEAYRYMNYGPGKISGLGPAFFTKWLSFVTARGDVLSPQTAPILDALVIRWLSKNAQVNLRRANAQDYTDYLDLLQEWGAGYGLTPAALEERIFRVIRDDGVTSSAQPAG